MRALPLAPTLAAGALLLAACSGESSGPSTTGQVTVNIATVAAPGVSHSSLLTDTVVSGSDTLLLESVQVVLRDIRFKRIDDDACDDDGDHPGGDDDSTHSIILNSHDDGDDDNDACEFSNAGPFLLDLPLGPGVERAFTVPVDTGTYDELRIKVHKPEDGGDAKDVAFLAAHPEFSQISIRATGTFNGTPFTFESDINAQQRINLIPPITVTDSTLNVDVTIRVETANWFRNGGMLIDPATANKGGPNANEVRDNIRDSFRAFRDGNHDGCDDDDPSDGHGGHDD
jgi:hypothetical protein